MILPNHENKINILNMHCQNKIDTLNKNHKK